MYRPKNGFLYVSKATYFELGRVILKLTAFLKHSLEGNFCILELLISRMAYPESKHVAVLDT